MQRSLFGPDHEDFRATMRKVFEQAAPHQAEWEEAGRMPDDFLRGLGDAGLFGLNVPEADGGAGVGYSYKVVAWEEAARARVGTGSARVHTDVVTPYFVAYATPEQKQRWMPGIIAGMVLSFAKAMGEFGATITFVSSIPGETQTIPSAIYAYTQVPGGEGGAMRLTLVSIVISIAALWLSEWLARRVRRRVHA